MKGTGIEFTLPAGVKPSSDSLSDQCDLAGRLCRLAREFRGWIPFPTGENLKTNFRSQGYGQPIVPKRISVNGDLSNS